MFAPGARVGDDGTIVEVRDVPGEVVLLVRWKRDPRLYGIPIALSDTDREFYYTDFPVASTEEWLDSVGLGVEILLDTGFRETARRSSVEDYIELRADGGWPVDERFYYDVVDPSEDISWERVPYVAAAGLDPGPAVAAREAGTLIGWVTGYENNATGEPYVGHAVVSWSGDSAARLEHLEVSNGVPVTVSVDLAHLAAHAAAATGVLQVATRIELDELSLVGFRPGPEGQRVLDTSFLGADPDAAARLFALSLTRGGRWGQDRDVAGRYLPPSRPARWWHRLRNGVSGAPPRRYIG